MKRLLCIFTVCLGTSVALNAQTTPLPYTYGFDNTTGWQTFRKGATPTYTFEIKTANPFAGTGNLYHDYPVGGGPAATDDWYVSPPFSFASGGKIDSLRRRFAGFGTPGAGDTVSIYLLKGSADPAMATSRTMLYDFRDANYINDNTWNKITNIAIPITPGTSYIAIRYRTVVNWLDVSFDNLRVSGNATNVNTVYKAGTHFHIAPNPATSQLNIQTKESFERINVYDMTGRKVIGQAFQQGVNIASLSAGTYVLELIDQYGQQGKTLFVKQ
jgi:hypothetical protein